jgi:DNA polymerase-3 subunit delta
MITTLTGPNHFMLQQRLKQLTDAYVIKYGDLGLTRIDGEEAGIERMQAAILSLPFLSPKQLVILQQPSQNKDFLSQAAALLARIDESTDVILVEPKLDKRQSYYKLLRAETQFEVFEELDGTKLARWLVITAQELGGQLHPSAAQTLMRRVGPNQQLLFQELNKLVLYQPDVTNETIELLTEAAPQSSIFDLIEAAVNGRVRQAIKLYDEQRLARVEPQQIIAMFTWQLQILALIRAAGQRSATEIAKEAGLSPYTVNKSMSLARSIPSSELAERIKALLDIDKRSKSSAIDADQALRHYILLWGTISSK